MPRSARRLGCPRFPQRRAPVVCPAHGSAARRSSRCRTHSMVTASNPAAAPSGTDPGQVWRELPKSSFDHHLSLPFRSAPDAVAPARSGVERAWPLEEYPRADVLISGGSGPPPPEERPSGRRLAPAHIGHRWPRGCRARRTRHGPTEASGLPPRLSTDRWRLSQSRRAPPPHASLRMEQAGCPGPYRSPAMPPGRGRSHIGAVTWARRTQGRSRRHVAATTRRAAQPAL